MVSKLRARVFLKALTELSRKHKIQIVEDCGVVSLFPIGEGVLGDEFRYLAGEEGEDVFWGCEEEGEL